MDLRLCNRGSLIVLLVATCFICYLLVFIPFHSTSTFTNSDYQKNLQPVSNLELNTDYHQSSEMALEVDNNRVLKNNLRDLTNKSRWRMLNRLDKNLTMCHSGTKVFKFLYVKIPKTGSSTLLGIFSRFALNYSLKILRPTKCYHLLKKTNCEDTNTNNPDLKIGPPTNEKADVMMNHYHYDPKELNKHMKGGYKLIVSVREPISWIISCSFYKRHLDANSVIENRELFFKNGQTTPGGRKYHLKQLQYLGFNYDNHSNISAIYEYIHNFLSKRIDIAILNDQYDPSLLILKKRLCWEYKDIFYHTYTVGTYKSAYISEAARTKLLSPEYNLGEKLLYDAINRTWWQQPEVEDPDFWKEVAYFTNLNKRISAEVCVKVKNTNLPKSIPATVFHDRIEIDVKFCCMLLKNKTTLKGIMDKYIKGLRNSTTL